jgi:SPP1 gp7 family putative phage head morphogenesis protein
MGLLDKLFNAIKPAVNEPTKQAERIEKKTIRQQMYRFNQELKSWKSGVSNFEDPYNPICVDLIRVYNDVIIDAHLSASIDSRIIRTTSKDFKVVDDKNEELNEETEIFTSPWFRDFLRLALESKFFGYSLIQFGDLKGKRFKSVELIPREYVYAQKNAVRKSPYDSNDLIYFDDAPYDAWLMGVGKPSDLGLLMKAAPLVIYKKTAIGSWTEFAELFGAPFRLGKTNIRDKELRDNMFDMLENMGRNAFGVFDESDSLEFIRDGKTDSHNVYNQLIERVNSEVSKLILGSTMTMDAGSSRSQSEVHERTSAAINKEDAFFITSLVNDELIPFLNKYHGFNITGRFMFDDTENTTKAEQFKIDSELIKLGFNVPKAYLTDTYGTPIDEKEENDDETDGPKGPKKESAEGDELDNSIKKKTTLASIYEAFTSESSLHVCNTLDYEETPLPEWSDEYVEEVIAGVYSGLYTIDNLPANLYNEIGARLMQGLYDGLATGEALSTIKDPEYIKTLQKNIFTFSGAKTWHEVKLMSDYLIDENGNPRSFKEYKDYAKKVFGEFNVNYLKTEINHAKGSAQMADKWKQFGEEAELFPYLRYVTAGDDRVRPAHKALNGIVKRYDSPFWKENAPLNGWNCRCDLKQVEEAIETPDDVIEERINKETDGKGLQTPDYMKNNPGVEVFGKEHPYFKIPRAFKKDQANNFGLPEPPKLSSEKIVKEIKKAQEAYTPPLVSLDPTLIKSTIKDLDRAQLEDLINNQDGAAKVLNDFRTDLGIRTSSERTGAGALKWAKETGANNAQSISSDSLGHCATSNKFINIVKKKDENINFEVVNMVHKAEDLVKEFPETYYINTRNHLCKKTGISRKTGLPTAEVVGKVKDDGFVLFHGITEASGINSKSIAPLITHEVNHAIHNSIDKMINENRFKTSAAATKYGVKLSDSVTTYGSSNWSEFYAENMAVYVHAHDYLKKEHGKVYDFLVNLHNELGVDIKTFKIAK